MTATPTDSSTVESAADLGVWAELIGQAGAVSILQRAVAGEPHAMSHAWLFTGPPGSGRSNAARAFAAALECSLGGCGRCTACRTALSGAHPDVTLVRTELLSIGVDEVRELVRRAVMRPILGRWQVIVIEEMVPHGGLGSRVKEIAWDRRATCRLDTFSLQDEFHHVYGSHEDLLAAHGLTREAILAKTHA